MRRWRVSVGIGRLTRSQPQVYRQSTDAASVAGNTGACTVFMEKEPRVTQRFDATVFRDVTWWGWVAAIALLVTRFATDRVEPVYAAIALCAALAAYDLRARRGD